MGLIKHTTKKSHLRYNYSKDSGFGLVVYFCLMMGALSLFSEQNKLSHPISILNIESFEDSNTVCRLPETPKAILTHFRSSTQWQSSTLLRLHASMKRMITPHLLQQTNDEYLLRRGFKNADWQTIAIASNQFKGDRKIDDSQVLFYEFGLYNSKSRINPNHSVIV